MRIGLIINPAANAGRGAKAGLQVQELLLDAGLAVLNLSANTLEQARENGHRAIASKLIDGLIVVGGDGMVHLATNLCAQTEVPFGLVAAGTGNDAASVIAEADRRDFRTAPTAEQLEILRQGDEYDTLDVPTVAMVGDFPLGLL